MLFLTFFSLPLSFSLPFLAAIPAPPGGLPGRPQQPRSGNHFQTQHRNIRSVFASFSICRFTREALAKTSVGHRAAKDPSRTLRRTCCFAGLLVPRQRVVRHAEGTDGADIKTQSSLRDRECAVAWGSAVCWNHNHYNLNSALEGAILLAWLNRISFSFFFFVAINFVFKN